MKVDFMSGKIVSKLFKGSSLKGNRKTPFMVRVSDGKGAMIL